MFVTINFFSPIDFLEKNYQFIDNQDVSGMMSHKSKNIQRKKIK